MRSVGGEGKVPTSYSLAKVSWVPLKSSVINISSRKTIWCCKVDLYIDKDEGLRIVDKIKTIQEA